VTIEGAAPGPATPEPTPAEAPPNVATPTTGSLPPIRRKRNRTPLLAIIVVVVVVVAVLAVGYDQHWFTHASSGTTCGSDVTLQADGAQFVEPLLDAWIYEFGGQTGASVSYPASGSGPAITHFSESPPLLDLAVADNPLNASERASMPAQPLTLPVIGGAETIIYNLPGVPGHLNLTGPILADIYDGTITKWNNGTIAKLNPGVSLPDDTIIAVHRGDPAGATFVFTDFLSQSSTYWAANVGKGLSVPFSQFTNATQLGPEHNSALILTVATTSYSIGYTDLTDTLNYKTPLQYAAIENPSGHFIVPTVANTVSAIDDKLAATPSMPNSTGNWYNVTMVNAPGAPDYPIVTLVYAYVYQDASELTPLPSGAPPNLAKAETLVYFLDWVLTTGQGYADATSPTLLYYAALPASLISIDNAGISTMTFNGAPIPACS